MIHRVDKESILWVDTKPLHLGSERRVYYLYTVTKWRVK
jgi:hypothetical protein